MSILADAEATCPTCGAAVAFEFPASVNADRRPDLRDGILDGSLFHESCASCGEALSFAPRLTYLDMGRKQWIVAEPGEARGGWAEAEQAASGVFAAAFGAGAPAAARALGHGLKARLVFGTAALAEKILAFELGLDDAALEAAKLMVIAEGPARELDPASELRLTGEDQDLLVFARVEPETGAVRGRVGVPRELYTVIKGGGEAWAPLLARLAGPLYVDLGRVTLAPAEG
jgi:hypothetical protein